MAKSHPHQQSLLKKTLLEKKIFRQVVLMYERLMEAMRDENSFDDILKIIITSVTQGLGYDRAGIFLANWDRMVVERVIGIDRFGKFEGTGSEYPLLPNRSKHGFSNIINGLDRGHYTNNIQKKISKAEWENCWKKKIDPGVFCNAVVPMTVENNKTIGILAVDNLFTQRKLNKTDLITLKNFATQAGLAIESFKLHERIRDLTIKDSLTGAYNRRYFDNYLPREVQRCRRYKRLLSLLYVDLDHFKNINDQYGHPAGDLVLKQVAHLLAQGLRNVDMVVRMGGDEFAVILPEVGPDGAKVVAERLFKSVVDSLPPVEAMRKQNEKISVCMGVASFFESMVDYQVLMKLADESLYRAKTTGRNRIGSLVGGDYLSIPLSANPPNTQTVSSLFPSGG